MYKEQTIENITTYLCKVHFSATLGDALIY